MEIFELAECPRVARALSRLRETDARTLADQAELAAIPAPPFGEAERGRRMAQLLGEAGLDDVTTDEAGNVIARLPGSDTGTGADSTGAPILLAAHLDTVFPIETDVRVHRDGNRLYAPGIVDNARGLAALVALARALTHAGVTTRRPLVFVATVGEEGLGDLRGVKHLFREGSPWREAAAFVAIDGSGTNRIVNRAIGSLRLRVEIHGPGGHSWANWGTANPIHAVGVALAGFQRYAPPVHGRSSLSVGRVGGGTSVNAIPDLAWFELDIRSEHPDALCDLERRVRRTVERAVVQANRRRLRGSEPLRLDITVIGDRPSGATPSSSRIVAVAAEATRRIGLVPELIASSTDANVPMALGVPAITIGAGGEGGGMHTTEEWYANEGGPDGLERALLTALALAGLAGKGE